MARRRQARFIRPPACTKIWIGNGVGTTVLAGASKTLIGSLTASALLLRSFTIFRTYVEVLINLDQVGADELVLCTYGQIIVTDTAAAAGIASVPGPSGISGDPEADWYVWQAMTVRFEFITAAGIEGNSGHHYLIDSKAMRKVGPDDDIALVAQLDGSPGANFVTNGRMLI